MSIAYVVVKKGIHLGECAGVFSSENEARKAVVGFRATDDDYHSYDVVPYELNRPVRVVTYKNLFGKRSSDLMLPVAVFSDKGTHG